MTFKIHDGVEIDGKSLTNSGGTLTWGGVSVGSGGGVSISSNANNRVLTGDGSNAVAETNLTFDGTNLQIVGSSRGLITEKLRLGATDTSFIERDSTVNIGYRADGVHRFWTYNSSWLERAQLTDTGFNLLAGHSYHIGGTAVINSARGLTNITSGNIAGNLTIDYTGNATNDAGLYVANDNSDWGIYVNKDGTATYGIKIAADGAYPFQITNSSGTEKFRVDSDGDIETVRNINASGTVTADVSGATDHYYFQGKESGTTRYSVYENSNNVWINAWSGLYLRANQHGGSGGGLGASGAVFNAANGLSLGTYNSTNGGEANGRLQLYGSTANKQADLYCSNGNLHIDADDGNGIYLNWYGSQSATSTAGTYFGNANAGQVARIDGSGNFTLSGTVDGRDVAADGTKLDGIAASANNYSFPYTVSDAASNSTVVRRTGSGYIMGNYINMTANDVSSGLTKIACETGNDNYMRWSDAAGVRSFINVADGATNVTNNNQLTNGAGYITSANGGNANLLDSLDSNDFLRLDGSAPTTQENTNYAKIKRFYSNTNMATASGSQSSLEVFSQGSGNDAFMTFHVGSDYAIYLGLDGGTNKLSTGGWSAGAASYEIYHAGNKPSLATLGFTGASNANYITNNNQLTNGAGYATQSYVGTQISNLVDSSPAALNTLNELAAAIGDDASFSTTITNSIAAKLPLVTGVTAMHNTQGTQNTANTVLRTQVNGYTMLGWINTTSGATSSTLTRIYCSQDGYIRYQTPANFGVSISPHINFNNIANKPTLSSLGYTGATNANNYVLPATVVIGNSTTAQPASDLVTFNSYNDGNSTSGDQSSVQFYNGSASQDAFVAFHVSSDYAGYFGLDGTTNDLFWGGWSVGNVKNKIFHAGNSAQFTSALNTKLAGIATSANNYSFPYSISTAATANNVVRRDSGGDITGRYFFGAHFNQSSSNSENPAIGAFWTNSSADNYCRKATPAHVGSTLKAHIPCVRTDTGSTIGNNHTVTQKGQFTTGTSGQNNSAQSGQLNYHYGYQFGGAWSHPYPDLVLGYHTGVRIGGYHGYGGTRFYTDHPSRTTTMLFSVGNGDAHVRANNNIYAYTSDKRLKENFRPIENAVDKVKSIGGFIFDWRKDMMDKHEFTPDQEKDDAGLIAQEVQKVMPAAIKRAPFDHDLTKPNQSKSGEDFLTVQYEKMVPLLVEAIKEQQKQIDELKQKLETK